MKSLFESKNLALYEVIIKAPGTTNIEVNGETKATSIDILILYATESIDLVMREAKKESAKYKGGYIQTIHKIGDLFSVLLADNESPMRREIKLILDNEQAATPQVMTALFRNALNDIPTLKGLYTAFVLAVPSEVDKAFEHMLNKLRDKYDKEN